MLPTSAPQPTSCVTRSSSSVRRSGCCQLRHRRRAAGKTIPARVRRSGCCQLRHRNKFSAVSKILTCPSIRLLPTSAPAVSRRMRTKKPVSVDQVVANFGTNISKVSVAVLCCVRRSGCCQLRHHDFMLGEGNWTVCPSIRLLPTSAPAKTVFAPSGQTRVRRSGCCQLRHLIRRIDGDAMAVVSVDQVVANFGTGS